MSFNYHIVEGVLIITFQSMAVWSYAKVGPAGTFHDSCCAWGNDKRDTVCTANLSGYTNMSLSCTLLVF